MASEKSGESNTDSDGLRRAIINNIAVVHSVLSSDSFVLGIFELLEDDFIFVMPNKLLADRIGTTVEGLTGRRAGELGLPSVSIEKWVAVLRQCREERKALCKEFFSSYMGRDTWYEYSLSYIDGSGNLFFCVAVDVTERKQAENALEAGEAFLNNVFDSIQDGISVLDKDLNIIRVNHVRKEWYSHAMPIEGKKCFSAYHGRSTPCKVCPSRRAIDEKTARCDVVPYRGDRGEIRGWLEIFSFPLVDDHGVARVIEHVRDITERKRADEALQESEEKYRLLAETAPDMIYIIDKDFRVKYVNRAAADALGGTPENLPGKQLEALFPEDSAREMREGLQWVMDSGRTLTGEMVNYFPGRTIPMHVILTPFCDREGKTIGVMGISRDISDRKKTEAALLDAKAQAELYLDLLGHDINNMHQIALGYLELARAKHPETVNREYLDKPIEVLYRSAGLIKNVRKLQKLRNDELGSGIVDLAEVLTDVQREYGETAGKVLTLDLNGNVRCQVRANELLYDVFANLVSNAVNHTGDGTSIAIVLERTEENGGRYYRVSVEDDGPGIPDDIKGRVFDRMLKGASRAKGLGLGLYLVKSLVESYGGRACVEDRFPGDYSKGARFVVILPEAGP